ncbi:MAG: lysozyme [Cyanobacteria bacterium Co-bin8]|nr:lysozyme [Cyanobacteria bacterium Co-bin8]
MGTWIKETDKAIYLMQGGYWISRISKYPSNANPKEQVLNISGLRSWFMRDDYPKAMTVSIGTGTPEPEPMPPLPPTPPPVPPTTPPPAGARQANAAGVEIIKHFEGVRLKAYQDSVGVWTIGYGHTSAAGAPNVTPGLTITQAEAENILKRDLGLFERGVIDAVKVTVNDNQFSSLVSFSFNVGLGNLRSSTLLRKLNAGDYSGAANEFPRWVNAGGQQLPGLVRRRNAERALFLSQNYRAFM